MKATQELAKACRGEARVHFTASTLRKGGERRVSQEVVRVRGSSCGPLRDRRPWAIIQPRLWPGYAPTRLLRVPCETLP